MPGQPCGDMGQVEQLWRENQKEALVATVACVLHQRGEMSDYVAVGWSSFPHDTHCYANFKRDISVCAKCLFSTPWLHASV